MKESGKAVKPSAAAHGALFGHYIGRWGFHVTPGDNDGTIDVETTKLTGARDFLVVPVLHSFIMDNATVQECVLRFLRHGHFVSERQQHPLEKRP